MEPLPREFLRWTARGCPGGVEVRELGRVHCEALGCLASRCLGGVRDRRVEARLGGLRPCRGLEAWLERRRALGPAVSRSWSLRCLAMWPQVVGISFLMALVPQARPCHPRARTRPCTSVLRLCLVAVLGLQPRALCLRSPLGYTASPEKRLLGSTW